MTIDVVCRVVDNYGDIGVAYRLARALSELEHAPRLRLVVDDLAVFGMLEPDLDPGRNFQTVHGMTVLSWAGPDPETAAAWQASYSAAPALVVIECFACGRPDWLEAMLFRPGDGAVKTIVNLEYLTAEDYAGDFHRLPSLTRSRMVRKFMFMPGFSPRTGGLILDKAFMRVLRLHGDPGSARLRREQLVSGFTCGVGAAGTDRPSSSSLAERYWVPVFGYERNYSRLVEDLAAFNKLRPVLALAAEGKSQGGLVSAWERAGRPFPLARLPFLPQAAWDEVLVASDFLVVRGEDSMARAALSGRPFLWQAYPQDESHQLVKVKALLERMRPHFSERAFAPVREAFIAFNDRARDGNDVAGTESILPLLKGGAETANGYADFAGSLAENGNLALNLMTYLGTIVYDGSRHPVPPI